MAWNKGVLALLTDPRQEFADKTGCVLTGMTLRVTLTGWQVIVKRFDPAGKKKEVCFIDAWTLEECFELLYDGLLMAPTSLVWKDDKF